MAEGFGVAACKASDYKGDLNDCLKGEQDKDGSSFTFDVKMAEGFEWEGHGWLDHPAWPYGNDEEEEDKSQKNADRNATIDNDTIVTAKKVKKLDKKKKEQKENEQGFTPSPEDKDEGNESTEQSTPKPKSPQPDSSALLQLGGDVVLENSFTVTMHPISNKVQQELEGNMENRLKPRTLSNAMLEQCERRSAAIGKALMKEVKKAIQEAVADITVQQPDIADDQDDSHKGKLPKDDDEDYDVGVAKPKVKTAKKQFNLPFDPFPTESAMKAYERERLEKLRPKPKNKTAPRNITKPNITRKGQMYMVKLDMGDSIMPPAGFKVPEAAAAPNITTKAPAEATPPPGTTAPEAKPLPTPEPDKKKPKPKKELPAPPPKKPLGSITMVLEINLLLLPGSCGSTMKTNCPTLYKVIKEAVKECQPGTTVAKVEFRRKLKKQKVSSGSSTAQGVSALRSKVHSKDANLMSTKIRITTWSSKNRPLISALALTKAVNRLMNTEPDKSKIEAETAIQNAKGKTVRFSPKLEGADLLNADVALACTQPFGQFNYDLIDAEVLENKKTPDQHARVKITDKKNLKAAFCRQKCLAYYPKAKGGCGGYKFSIKSIALVGPSVG